MPEILLCTLNARYSHASLGLRYLLANLGDLRERAALREFTIHDAPMHIVERLVLESPRIVGFGVYIWNLVETTQVVRLLRAVAPHIRIVVGGPELSHESEQEPIVTTADVLITGEADLTFPPICAALLEARPVPGVVVSPKPPATELRFPYAEYSDDDLAHRLVYVEASRGCPYTCEFCLSSVDNGVRAFAMAPFLAEMQSLLDRGSRTFKFVDRTFNLSPRVSVAILDFFLERVRPGLFLHFEMVPDRLPEVLRERVARFPEGVLQFEVGIQTFSPEVGDRVSRRMDLAKTFENLEYLRDHTKVHVHADLIVGLPGETLETFATSFDTLWALRPGEVQGGILKRLKGTPISRHASAFEMVYNPAPPYDLLSSRELPFPLMQRLKRFARYFEVFVNSGRFKGAVAALMASRPSPFQAFLAFSDWLWATEGREHAISLVRQYDLFATWLEKQAGLREDVALETLAADFLARGERRYLPERLRPLVERAAVMRPGSSALAAVVGRDTVKP